MSHSCPVHVPLNAVSRLFEGLKKGSAKKTGLKRILASASFVKRGMGRMLSKFKFEANLGTLSAYRMKGVDFIVVRRKWGPPKRENQTIAQVQKLPP